MLSCITTFDGINTISFNFVIILAAYLNPFKLEFTIVIFIHYKPRISVAILDLQWTVSSVHENFHSKTLSCGKIKFVHGNFKWCFNASWEFKWLIQYVLYILESSEWNIPGYSPEQYVVHLKKKWLSLSKYFRVKKEENMFWLRAKKNDLGWKLIAHPQVSSGPPLMTTLRELLA